jgi:hypothetical protein
VSTLNQHSTPRFDLTALLLHVLSLNQTPVSAACSFPPTSVYTFALLLHVLPFESLVVAVFFFFFIIVYSSVLLLHVLP